jgi:hypothetical protein
MSASLNMSTGLLTVSGEGFKSLPGLNNDINSSLLTFFASGGNLRTISSLTPNVDVTSESTFSLTLSPSDLSVINLIANSNGIQNIELQAYDLSANQDWNGTGSLVDNGPHTVTVSGQIEPSITSANYDFSAKQLSITGTGFRTISGASNDINSTKFTISAGTKTYTLTSNTLSVEILSSTSALVTLGTIDAAMINSILCGDGTGTTPNIYNLSVALNWNGSGSSADAINVITVSNYAAPILNSVNYNSLTGQLTLSGNNFAAVAGNNNDIDAATITIVEGGNLYKLTSSTQNVDVTNSDSAVLTLGGLDRAKINAILNQNGTQSTNLNSYQIILDDNWDLGAPSILNISNSGLAITVSNYNSPSISSATYNYVSGVLTLTGSNLSSSLTANDDIAANLFIIGDGLTTRTISLLTSNIEIFDNTTAAILMSNTDRAYINYILNKNGTAAYNARAYNLQANTGWNPAAPISPLISTIPITVTNYTNPSISSATYNRTDGNLVVNGSNMRRSPTAGDDINPLKIKFRGLGNSTFTLTAATSSVDISDSNTFTVIVSGVDKTTLELLLDKDGGVASDAIAYNLELADDWNFNNPVADITDLLSNQIIVSGINDPIIANIGFDNRSSIKKLIVSNNSLPQYSTLEIIVKQWSNSGDDPTINAIAEYTIDLASATNRTLGSHNLNAAVGANVAEGDKVFYRYINGSLKSNWIADSTIPITPVNAKGADGNFLLFAHSNQFLVENNHSNAVTGLILSVSKDNGNLWTNQSTPLVNGNNTQNYSGTLLVNDQISCAYLNSAGNYSLASSAITLALGPNNGNSPTGSFLVLANTNQIVVSNSNLTDGKMVYISKNGASSALTGIISTGVATVTLATTANDTIRVATEDNIGNTTLYGTLFTVGAIPFNSASGLNRTFIVYGHTSNIKIKNINSALTNYYAIIDYNGIVQPDQQILAGDINYSIPGGITGGKLIHVSIKDTIGNTSPKSVAYQTIATPLKDSLSDGGFTINISGGTVTVLNSTQTLNGYKVHVLKDLSDNQRTMESDGSSLSIPISGGLNSGNKIKVYIEDVNGNTSEISSEYTIH